MINDLFSILPTRFAANGVDGLTVSNLVQPCAEDRVGFQLMGQLGKF